MRTCAHCDGFVPRGADACPHCDSELAQETTLGFNPILHGMMAAATAITLMACYGGGDDYFGEMCGMEQAPEVFDPAAPSVVGDSSEGTDANSGSCGGRGLEVVYAYTPPAPGVYLIETTSEGDTVLYVREPGCGEELACDDESGEGSASRLTVDLDGAEVEIIVDSYYNEDAGPFTLTVSPQ